MIVLVPDDVQVAVLVVAALHLLNTTVEADVAMLASHIFDVPLSTPIHVFKTVTKEPEKNGIVKEVAALFDVPLMLKFIIATFPTRLYLIDFAVNVVHPTIVDCSEKSIQGVLIKF